MRTMTNGAWRMTLLGLTVAALTAFAGGDMPPGPGSEPRVIDLSAGDANSNGCQALLRVKRVYVDRFSGGETAPQIRDMLINALHASGLFAITEDEERADAILRGSAEDLVFTDVHQSADSLSARLSLSTSDPVDKSTQTGRDSRSSGATIGENESTRIQERRHEASAAVRLVGKDGDVIWATTQESNGAKFHGASADVAQKISRQLLSDYLKAKQVQNGATISRPSTFPPN